MLAYYDVTVQHVNPYVMEISQQSIFKNKGGMLNAMVIVIENGIGDLSSNICDSLNANALRKGMNLSLLPLAMSK